MKQSCCFGGPRAGSKITLTTIPFETKDNGLPSSVLRRISVLKELEHENVIRLLKVKYTPEGFNLFFKCRGGHNVDDLSEIIYDPFHRYDIKILLFQILKGVCYCHSQKVLHRNLQPENLIIDPDTGKLKLANFGETRTFDAAPSKYSVDVGTLGYKAPELILRMQQSTPAVDMWSVGCIFAEMVTREKLFGGDKDHVVHDDLCVMENIIRMLGVPSENEWPGVTAACTNFGLTHMLTSAPLPNFADKFPRLEASGIDLLSKMLRLTPGRRISARAALEHHYFRNLK